MPVFTNWPDTYELSDEEIEPRTPGIPVGAKFVGFLRITDKKFWLEPWECQMIACDNYEQAIAYYDTIESYMPGQTQMQFCRDHIDFCGTDSVWLTVYYRNPKHGPIIKMIVS